MSFWSVERVAEALGKPELGSDGKPSGSISGINTDSRSVAASQLFVALAGDTFDGHDYVESAVAQGAAAVVVNRAFAGSHPGVPVFRVDDTLVALGQLATAWRHAWGKSVVMVAGSNGKTTTKDLIRAALASQLDVHATSGNLNNRIGVPLTLLSIPPTAEIAVVEAGTNLPGEVGILRAIIDPDIAVVTSVGEEHLEGLGDIAGVLREESDAFDGVGVAIVPASQPEIAEAAAGRAGQVVTAGLDDADVMPRSWSMGPDGRGMLELDSVSMTVPLRGLHNLRNAMLAIAVARTCGVSDENAASGIARMTVPRMRSAWEEIGRATVVNDAYNANPGSTRAAIDLIHNIGSERQRIIILGTMRELGAASAKCHDDISLLALASGADVIAGVGEFADSLARVGANDARIVASQTVDDIWPLILPRIERDAVILLKASRGVKLEQLVPHITTWANS